MKAFLCFAVFPVTVIAASPLALPAQRDVHNLTLLPGPMLLSPASAPQSGPTITIIPAWAVQANAASQASPPPLNTRLVPPPRAGTWTFVPANPAGEPTHRQKPTQPVPPESLHFDSKLHSPAPAPSMRFVPEKKQP